MIAASGTDDAAAWKAALKAHPQELGEKVGYIGLRPPRKVTPKEFVEKMLKSTDDPHGWPQWHLAGAVATGIGEYIFFGWNP